MLLPSLCMYSVDFQPFVNATANYLCPASYPIGTGGGGITPGLSGRGVKITTHIHVVPRLRKCGAIPPLNQNVFMAWWLLKHKTALILLYLILYFSYLSYKLLLFPPISAIRWLFLCVYPATPQRNFTSPVCILVSWLFLQTMSYFHIWLFVQQSFCIISVVAFRIITDSFPAHFLVGYNLIHACNTHTHTHTHTLYLFRNIVVH
jgi:hypothetical protein